MNTEYRLLLDTRERLGDACSLLTWDDVGVVDGKHVARFNTHPVFTCWFILLALLFVLHGTWLLGMDMESKVEGVIIHPPTRFPSCPS